MKDEGQNTANQGLRAGKSLPLNAMPALAMIVETMRDIQAFL